MIPANYVKPYVKRGKSDAVDAEAICEAVTRPAMRFVAPKSEARQAVLFLHRARDLIVRQRTQLSNMLCGFLAEFDVIIPQGTGAEPPSNMLRAFWTERNQAFLRLR